MQNAAGQFIGPTLKGFQAAAATADWAHAKDFYLVMTNAPGADAYPITATTCILMYKTPKDAARTNAALKFFKWALEHGQARRRGARLRAAAADAGDADRGILGAAVLVAQVSRQPRLRRRASPADDLGGKRPEPSSGLFFCGHR